MARIDGAADRIVGNVVGADTAGGAVQVGGRAHAVGDRMVRAGCVAADTKPANDLAALIERNAAAEGDNPPGMDATLKTAAGRQASAGRKPVAPAAKGASIMFVTPFGFPIREAHDAPDAAELAEEVILSMIERSKAMRGRHRRRRQPPGARTGGVAGGP